jgi:hypothetical protein
MGKLCSLLNEYHSNRRIVPPKVSLNYSILIWIPPEIQNQRYEIPIAANQRFRPTQFYH